jgi:DNA-binding NtrC family response regulator
VVELVRRAGPTDAHVLITGESGTGKERVALALHQASPRAEGPFVPVECGAIAREQLDAELFGRERHEGLVLQADGGTLFIDEVSELPPALQAKLLHVLEEKLVRRQYPVNVRVIAATHRDLAAAAERGQFRKDLYYRLNVISLELAPLRSRAGDALRLAKQFAEHYARKLGKRVSGLDAEFSAFIENHPWPGNVRELENMMKRIVVLQNEHLLRDELASKTIRPSSSAALHSIGSAREEAGGDDHQTLKEIARRAALDAQREAIRDVLERVHWNRAEAARLLGISYKTLLYKIDQCGLARKRARSA